MLFRSVTELRKATEFDPGPADAHYTLGVTLWQQGNFNGATEELRAAIQAKPDYAEAYYTLGTVLKQKGELPEAVTDRKSTRLNSSHSQISYAVFCLKKKKEIANMVRKADK